MNKFLWFLGGCATGLLAAAAISVLNEDTNSPSSSSSHDGDDEELENDTSPAEEAPIFPGENFKAASGFFSNAYQVSHCDSERPRTEEKTPNDSEPSEVPA